MLLGIVVMQKLNLSVLANLGQLLESIGLLLGQRLQLESPLEHHSQNFPLLLYLGAQQVLEMLAYFYVKL